MPLKAMMAKPRTNQYPAYALKSDDGKPTKPNILSPMLPITAKGEKPRSESE